MMKYLCSIHYAPAQKQKHVAGHTCVGISVKRLRFCLSASRRIRSVILFLNFSIFIIRKCMKKKKNIKNITRNQRINDVGCAGT